MTAGKIFLRLIEFVLNSKQQQSARSSIICSNTTSSKVDCKIICGTCLSVPLKYSVLALVILLYVYVVI